MKSLRTILILIFFIGIGYLFIQKNKNTLNNKKTNSDHTVSVAPTSSRITVNSLTIAAMKQKPYPGSPLFIESTLTPGTNYNRYLVSYLSDGLKQYGLLTVPTGEKPKNGWPVILFNHGYIPPSQYSTQNSYSSFVNPLATAGYLVFKPDYRGNGKSDGIPSQIYVSPDYLTDSMNALASIKQYSNVNPQKIGVLGHSMGGKITLHEQVISKDFKAAAIIAGTIGDETSILDWWEQRNKTKSISGNDLDTYYKLVQMVTENGTPSSNPDYWNSIDPTKCLIDINTPIQILVGTADKAVPPNFSSSLRDLLQSTGKTVDYHEYVGADHNISPVTESALKEVVIFFDKYLKNGN